MKSAPLSFVIALLSTMIASQPPAPAQQPPSTAELEQLLLESEIGPAIDPEELREALIDFVIRAQGAAGNLQYLADVVGKIRDLDRAALVQFIGALPNPEQYLASIRSLGRGRTAAPAPHGPNGPDVPERQRVRADSTRVSSAATALFDPDYAPILNADGSDSTYREVFLNPLFQDGYISSSSANTERCDWNTSADLTRTLTATQIAANIAQAVCTIAACDPTGIVCASVCGPYSVAVAALESLQLLAKACEEHEAGVNGAEIQAAYENTKIIAGQVDDVIDTVDQVQSATTSLQSSLSAHDAAIQNAISVHDGTIKDAIANHDAAVTSQISVHDATVDATIDTHNTTILARSALARSLSPAAWRTTSTCCRPSSTSRWRCARSTSTWSRSRRAVRTRDASCSPPPRAVAPSTSRSPGFGWWSRMGPTWSTSSPMRRSLWTSVQSREPRGRRHSPDPVGVPEVSGGPLPPPTGPPPRRASAIRPVRPRTPSLVQSATT